LRVPLNLASRALSARCCYSWRSYKILLVPLHSFFLSLFSTSLASVRPSFEDSGPVPRQPRFEQRPFHANHSSQVRRYQSSVIVPPINRPASLAHSHHSLGNSNPSTLSSLSNRGPSAIPSPCKCRSPSPGIAPLAAHHSAKSRPNRPTETHRVRGSPKGRRAVLGPGSGWNLEATSTQSHQPVVRRPGEVSTPTRSLPPPSAHLAFDCKRSHVDHASSIALLGQTRRTKWSQCLFSRRIGYHSRCRDPRQAQCPRRPGRQHRHDLSSSV
jgi:hypothetical protein